MSKETMKLALEALEYHTAQTRPITQTQETITAIKQALEAPVQEPVAWMHKETGLLRQANKAKGGDFEPNHWTPLYTTPPAQRQWVGLTTEDMATCIDEPAWDLILRKAEQILKEKNT